MRFGQTVICTVSSSSKQQKIYNVINLRIIMFGTVSFTTVSIRASTGFDGGFEVVVAICESLHSH